MKEVLDNTTKDTFSSGELSALRNDLLQGVQIDSREAAELRQVFLMGRGYAGRQSLTPWRVSRCQAARCLVLQRELEALALMMSAASDRN